MPSYTLYYFNGRGRAEICRMMFDAAGVKYTDKRIELNEWDKYRNDFPCNYLPCLEMDGGMRMPETMAICRYISRQYGFYPKSSIDMMRCDYISDCFYEIMHDYMRYFHWKNGNFRYDYMVGGMQSSNMNSGMMGSDMSFGMMCSGVSSGMQSPNMNSGMQGSNMNSGMQGSNMNSGMQGSNMNSGMQGSNMNSGMQGSNKSSGMQGCNMGSGMQGSNTSSGMQGSKMNSGMQGSNTSSGMQGSNTSSGMQGSNMNSGMMGSNMVSGMMVSEMGMGSNMGSGMGIDNYMQWRYMNSFNRIMPFMERTLSMKNGGNNFFMGNEMMWCDMMMYCCLENMYMQNQSMLSQYPKLMALYKRVAQHPKVSSYLKSRSMTIW